MKIESLKVFCDLAENQSFTKAAQVNSVTQSAVSQQISMLERVFKTLLVQRGKRRFNLTPAGRLLYEYSNQVLQSTRELEGALEKTKQALSGTIRLATIHSFGLHDLPLHLKPFLAKHSTAKVQVFYRHTDQIYEDVVENLADLGLVAYPIHGRSVEIIPLRKESLVLICHPNHALAKRKSIKAKALNGQTFVGLNRDIPTRRAIDRLLKSYRVPATYTMEFDNIETVKRAVEINSGVAIVPQSNITRELADGTLAAVRFEDSDFVRPLAIVHSKAKVLTPVMKNFIAALKEPR
jgi:DNA-binding transcriptional LysR family regulator